MRRTHPYSIIRKDCFETSGRYGKKFIGFVCRRRGCALAALKAASYVRTGFCPGYSSMTLMGDMVSGRLLLAHKLISHFSCRQIFEG